MIVGNGMFKPIISTLVGRLYSEHDIRRDSGFTIFYMGINLGAMVAPIATQILAQKFFGSDGMPAYKVVFLAAGVGMILSFIWFWFGRKMLQGIGAPRPDATGMGAVFKVLLIGVVIGIPMFYLLLTIDATALQILLMLLFIVPAIMLVVEGIREGKVARDRVIAMLLIFGFNVMFWMFFEQAGSSFNFLADKIVDREHGRLDLPDRVVPVGQLGGDHHARAGARLVLGEDGQRRIRRFRASSASA